MYIKYTHQCQTQPPSNTARRKCKSGAGIYAAAATAAIRPNSTPKPPPPRLFTCHLQRRKYTIRTCLGCLTHIHVMKVHISPNTLDQVTGSVLCERFLVRLHWAYIFEVCNDFHRVSVEVIFLLAHWVEWWGPTKLAPANCESMRLYGFVYMWSRRLFMLLNLVFFFLCYVNVGIYICTVNHSGENTFQWSRTAFEWIMNEPWDEGWYRR